MNMRANFFNGEYNPKIDYLICKNLLIKNTYRFNEFELRKGYLKNYKRHDKEMSKIIRIKKYLRKHKIYNFSTKNFLKLIYKISGKKIEYHYRKKLEDMKKDDIYDYIYYLRYLDNLEINELMLKIMLMYVYSKDNEIIIPQRGYIKELLKDVYQINGLKEIIKILETNTANINKRHDMRINDLIRKIIKNKKEEFLKEFPEVKEFGIYGSFAVNKENEYSDIDMLIISDDYNEELRELIKKYWSRYISINIDIKIVSYEEYDNELTYCMKKTLRMVK